MDKAVELFAAISFLVIGLSHLLQPKAWVEFFAMLRAKGRAGALVEGFLCLWLGVFIVSFHDIWSGPAASLSAVGALLVLKGTSRFCAPGLGLHMYERISAAPLWSIQVGGVLAIVLGAWFGYLWFR